MTISQTVFRKIICCILCLLAVMLSVLPVGALSQDGQQGSGQILTAKVHSLPSADSPVLGQIENGTTVKIMKRTGDFYLVECYDMTGYIARYQLRFRGNGECYVNCNIYSEETLVTEQLPFIQASKLRHSIVDLARAQLGTPYVFGGSRPGGFDCSGFTFYLYEQHGISLHRTASQQLQDGIVVAKDALQVGDLVFFREPGETTAASHVGIYAGEGRIIHAASTGIRYSLLESSYYSENYLGVRRIVNASTAELIEAVSFDPETLSRVAEAFRDRETE